MSNHNAVRVIHFESLTRLSFLSHCFTTREQHFGAEGFRYLRTPGSVRDNTLAALGFEGFRVAFSRQTHTDHVACIRSFEEAESLNASALEVDGLITDVPGLALWTVYADCTPVYVADQGKQVVGIAHSGWRGTINRIAPKMIQAMQTNFGSQLEDLVIVIGPSISQAHFEVGLEVSELFQETFGNVEGMIDHGYPKPHVDVRKAIVASLVEMGIDEKQIEVSSQCTYRDEALFYSYRRGNGGARMAAIIGIKPLRE